MTGEVFSGEGETFTALNDDGSTKTYKACSIIMHKIGVLH